ncbi:FadR/GntR family transcriptional regulator [Streptomyces mirabilis]|uniref:FadR/GntR family transcriptional regulator n=1 Tax=Streptomyces mirabilis TaxID=68239 RepID=UPI0036D03C24
MAELARNAAEGQRLGTKKEVRALCDVSVGTFNEALKLAQSRAIVQVRPGPGGGVFAGHPSPMVRLGNYVLALDANQTNVTEVVRMRDALDPLVVEDALEHASPAHLREMREQLTKMTTAVEQDDSLAFIRANWGLHSVIAQASPNLVLKSVYTSLLDTIESHTLSVLPSAGTSLPDYISARLDLHVRLVDAIESGDQAGALDAIQEHNTPLV